MDTPGSATSCAAELLAVVEPRAQPPAWRWLSDALPAPDAPLARGRFFGAYAGVGRRFTGAAGAFGADERARLSALGVAVPEAFSLADWARAALLLRAIDVAAADDHLAIATEAFRKGDNAERVALLRTLPLLPRPERFTALAVEACRTHVLEVFAAIACENPFPAAHFPQLNFNQLVIKAIFLELALERVLGWRSRCDPELRRVAADYEAERRAAGRSVPADLALISATEERL